MNSPASVKTKALLVGVALCLVTLAAGFQYVLKGIERGRNRNAVGNILSKSASQMTGPARIAYVQLLSSKKWLIADNSSVWITQDAGLSWCASYTAPVASGRRIQINGLSFIDGQTGFLVANDSLHRTTDSGTTWERMGAITSDPERVILESCFFFDLLNGWAVGAVWMEGWVNNPNIPRTVCGIFATRDGGRTWHRQYVNLPSEYLDEGTGCSLRDVFFKDASTGWAVGDGMIIRTVDGGERWQLARAAYGDFKRTQYSDGIGWATEWQGAKVAVTADSGRSWRVLKGPPGYGAWPAHVIFVTPRQGFATLLALYETSDGGRTWRRLTGSNKPGKAYDYVGRARDGSLIALGLNSGKTTAVVSADDGVTWHTLN